MMRLYAFGALLGALSLASVVEGEIWSKLAPSPFKQVNDLLGNMFNKLNELHSNSSFSPKSCKPLANEAAQICHHLSRLVATIVADHEESAICGQVAVNHLSALHRAQRKYRKVRNGAGAKTLRLDELIAQLSARMTSKCLKQYNEEWEKFLIEDANFEESIRGLRFDYFTRKCSRASIRRNILISIAPGEKRHERRPEFVATDAASSLLCASRKLHKKKRNSARSVQLFERGPKDTCKFVKMIKYNKLLRPNTPANLRELDREIGAYVFNRRTAERQFVEFILEPCRRLHNSAASDSLRLVAELIAGASPLVKSHAQHVGARFGLAAINFMGCETLLHSSNHENIIDQLVAHGLKCKQTNDY